MSKIFVDTNILVYSLDRFDPEKQQMSRKCLKRLTGQNKGVISTQVLQEFYVASTRKLGTDPLVAKEILNAFQRFEVVTVTPPIIDESIDCSILNRISFWDALIIVAAQSANCQTLWSEDLNPGQMIRGVTIENPLIF